MMISAAPPEARPTASSAQPVNRSRIQEQRGLPIGMGRMMGLETAWEILGGKGKLASALGIGIRALNHKLGADRGISNGDLLLAARELEAVGTKMLAHATKLRAEAGQVVS